MFVGGTGVGVFVGGTGVGVFVGGTGVAVGTGVGVFVGGTGVGVGDGVLVGGTGVSVGDGVLVGIAVTVGVGSGAAAASGVVSSLAAVGVAGTGSSPQAIAAAAVPTANRHAQRMDGRLDAALAGFVMLYLGNPSSVHCTISDRCRVLSGRGDAGMRAAPARFYRYGLSLDHSGLDVSLGLAMHQAPC